VQALASFDGILPDVSSLCPDFIALLTCTVAAVLMILTAAAAAAQLLLRTNDCAYDSWGLQMAWCLVPAGDLACGDCKILTACLS
jgi:hypothetical protein